MSFRRHLPTAIAGVCAAACLSGAGLAAGAGSQDAVLTLTYTAGNALTVQATGGGVLSAGSSATAIPWGTYQVTIIDDAADGSDPAHMFDLSGPGVNLMTDLQGGDDKSEIYTETLAATATYTFQDLAEPNLAPVVFKTSATPAATTSGPVTPPPSTVPTTKTTTTANGGFVGSKAGPGPLRGTLDASVDSRGALALTFRGKNVTTLRSGRYRLTIRDRSSKAGFYVEGAHRPLVALTTGSFVGRKTTTLDFPAGQWLYYPTVVGHKTYFIVLA